MVGLGSSKNKWAEDAAEIYARFSLNVYKRT
jgi:hypothetical protein